MDYSLNHTPLALLVAALSAACSVTTSVDGSPPGPSSYAVVVSADDACLFMKDGIAALAPDAGPRRGKGCAELCDAEGARCDPSAEYFAAFVEAVQRGATHADDAGVFRTPLCPTSPVTFTCKIGR